MPTVKPNESMKDYMSRCMSDQRMIDEAPDSKQRYKICMVHWQQKGKQKTMGTVEQKSIPLELKDMSKGKRETVFSHAVYNNIDHYGDVSRRGMFDKTWSENKSSIGFNINHDGNGPGKVMDVWDDEHKAYTQVKINAGTAGDDLIEMIDSGIISSASFEFHTLQREYKNIKGRRIRELTEVRHLKSTLATYDNPAVNPRTGIISMTKTNDIKNILAEIQENVISLEKFCREAKASDETILMVLKRVDEMKAIFGKYAATPAGSNTDPLEPDYHTTNEELAKKQAGANQLNLLILKHFV